MSLILILHRAVTFFVTQGSYVDSYLGGASQSPVTDGEERWIVVSSPQGDIGHLLTPFGVLVSSDPELRYQLYIIILFLLTFPSLLSPCQNIQNMYVHVMVHSKCKFLFHSGKPVRYILKTIQSRLHMLGDNTCMMNRTIDIWIASIMSPMVRHMFNLFCESMALMIQRYKCLDGKLSVQFL